MAEELPTPVWSGEFKLGSVVMKCHVLSDGQRIIEADSVWRFFDELTKDDGASPEEIDAFAKWQRGRG